MKKLAALIAAALFTLCLAMPSHAGEPKKEEPAGKSAMTGKKGASNDNAAKMEKKDGKKDDAKPEKRRRKEAAGC